MLTEENEKFVEFGIGGLSNCSLGKLVQVAWKLDTWIKVYLFRSNLSLTAQWYQKVWGENSETLILGADTAGYQAPVVQRVDNSIQRISPYPTDKMYRNWYILSTG